MGGKIGGREVKGEDGIRCERDRRGGEKNFEGKNLGCCLSRKEVGKKGCERWDVTETQFCLLSVSSVTDCQTSGVVGFKEGKEGENVCSRTGIKLCQS